MFSRQEKHVFTSNAAERSQPDQESLDGDTVSFSLIRASGAPYTHTRNGLETTAHAEHTPCDQAERRKAGLRRGRLQ